MTGYQTLINAALREYLDGNAPKIEDVLRSIIVRNPQAKSASEVSDTIQISSIFELPDLRGSA